MDEQREMNILEQAVGTFGERAQVIVAIEELSELTKALTKWLRLVDCGQGTAATVFSNISEERADVSIMLNQLDIIFGDNTEMEVAKLERLEALLNESREGRAG